MNGVQIITVSALSLLLAGGALVTAGAGFYSARAARRRHQALRHPYARALRRRPLITIMIHAATRPYGLADCLDSLAAGNYRKYEVVVIAKSRESIEADVKRFSTAHPSKRVRIQSDSPKSRQKALKTAKGELVMVLNAPGRLGTDTLKAAADYLALNPAASVHLVRSVVLPARPAIANLVERIEAAAVSQVYLAGNFYGQSGIINPRPAVYRRAVILKARPPAAVLRRAAGWLFSFIAIVLGAYGIFLAIAQITAYLLAILWSGLLLFLILAIWDSGGYSRRQRLELIMLTPALGGLLYLKLLRRFLNASYRSAAALF